MVTISLVRFMDLVCANFRCYDAEQKLDERDRHPINIKELHSFQPVSFSSKPTDD